MKQAVASGAALFAIVALLTAISVRPQAPATRPAKPSPSQAEPSPAATANTAKRKIPCKTPENASICYWAHGRLSFYSANGTWLLWKIGTGRLLKICDYPTYRSMQGTGDCADPEFPANLERIYDADERRWKRGGGHGDYFPPDVFGDFEICPLEPERKGERQYACIESAKITFVQK
jgi:hypothetical protein